MKALIKKILLTALLVLGPMSMANALAIVKFPEYNLTSWNDADLNASGDYVHVQTGALAAGTIGNEGPVTWFSLQWMGASDPLHAIGLDTVFFNSATAVDSIWTGAIGTGTDVTGDWSIHQGGATGGGGFGMFDSHKNLDGGGTNGISDETRLYFVLDDVTSFPTNANGASFDVHVRYTQSCSGWVSNGQTSSTSSGNCGGSTSVPEPSSILLMGLGLLGVGLMRRKKV